ncbi:MAG: class I SAM-dependent methyltransferase [Nitrospirota bacterium]|nr:class I SAM-dependent methyltransferase [Nitrospirota bacterium]
MSKIDFTQTLASGLGAYNSNVGQWWVNKTRNAAHAAAYLNIASHIVQCAQREKGLIIDYGCGTGLLMKRLVDVLPAWKFLGIDGSTAMLRGAETWARIKRIGRPASIEFRLAKLPDFSVSAPKADIIVFTFPNIVSVASERRQFEEVFRNDRDVAGLLAMKQEEGEGIEPLYDSLFMSRVVARNLRFLLRKGGLCIRVDYSQGARDELCRFDQVATLFEEGSLSAKQSRLQAEKFFKLLYSQYYPSPVIRDVYDQTKDKDFLEGGYLVSLLQAI